MRRPKNVCWHCGHRPTEKLTTRYCSTRCKKRGQRRQPYTGSRKGWVPLHDVELPVHGRCACGEPLHRKGQTSCSAACRARRSEVIFHRPILNDGVETLAEARLWDERVAFYNAIGLSHAAAQAWADQTREISGLEHLADDVALDKLAGHRIRWTAHRSGQSVTQTASVDTQARVVTPTSGRRYIEYVDRLQGYRATYLDAIESVR